MIGNGARLSWHPANPIYRAGAEIRCLVDTGTALDNPDFAVMAQAMGIHGVRLDDRLTVQCRLDENDYEKGCNGFDADMAALLAAVRIRA